MASKRLFATSRDGKIKITTVHILPLNFRPDFVARMAVERDDIIDSIINDNEENEH